MKKQKIVIISVLVTLLIIGGGLFILEKLNISHIFSNSTTGLSDDEKKTSLQEKATVNDETSTTNSQGTNQTSTSDNPKQSPNSSTTQGKYTAPTSSENITLSADKTSSSSVTVYTQLKDYSDGTCNLTVTNGNQANTQSAPVMYQSQYAICAGFNVPISSLGYGTWSIKLSVTSSGSITEKTITYEVNQ